MINIPAPMLEALLSLLRSLLIAGASFLVGKGYLNATIAEALIGVIMIAIPIGWGMYQKFAADRKTRALVAAAITDPRIEWTPEQRAEFEKMKSTVGAG